MLFFSLWRNQSPSAALIKAPSLTFFAKRVGGSGRDRGAASHVGWTLGAPVGQNLK